MKQIYRNVFFYCISILLFTAQWSKVNSQVVWTPSASTYTFIGSWFQDPAPTAGQGVLRTTGVLNIFSPNTTYSSVGSAISAGAGVGMILYASPFNAITFYEVGAVTSTTEAESITNNDYIAATVTIASGVNSLRVARIHSNTFNQDAVRSGSYSYALYVRDVTNGGAPQKLSNITLTQPSTTVASQTFARDGVPSQINEVLLMPGNVYEFRWYFYNVTLNYSKLGSSNPAPQANSIAIDNPTLFIQEANTVLPLQWVNVNGNINNNKQAIINYKVNETNVLKYQIEKSNDGINFNTIATIASKGNGENNYKFTEATVLDGVKYYRIKQIDLNSGYSYSSIVKLTNTKTGAITVYPNHAKNIVTISNATTGTKAFLIDINGKVLQLINFTQPSFTLNVSNLKSGVFVLKTTDGQAIKMIKE